MTTQSEALKYGVLLGWYCDDEGKSLKDKLADAVGNYELKFGKKPNLALVNEAEAQPVKGWEIKACSWVRPNHYWIGRQDAPTEGVGTHSGQVDAVAYYPPIERNTEPHRSKTKLRKPAQARRKG